MTRCAADGWSYPGTAVGVLSSGTWRICIFFGALSLLGCGREVSPRSPQGPQPVCRGLELASTQESTDDPDVLQFRIEPGDAAAPNNSIRFRLQNVSRKPLWVNARMFAESSLGEVAIDVTPLPAGKPVSDDCWVHPVPVQYVLLMPGSEISVVSVLHCLKFPAEGPWPIRAKYQDRKRHIPAAPLGAAWFSGTLLSNELQFHAWPPNVRAAAEK